MFFSIRKSAPDTGLFRAGKKRADFRVFKSYIIFSHFFYNAHSDKISSKIVVGTVNGDLPVDKETDRNKERYKYDLNDSANEPEFTVIISARKGINEPYHIKNSNGNEAADRSAHYGSKTFYSAVERIGPLLCRVCMTAENNSSFDFTFRRPACHNISGNLAREKEINKFPVHKELHNKAGKRQENKDRGKNSQAGSRHNAGICKPIKQNGQHTADSSCRYPSHKCRRMNREILHLNFIGPFF